jgi:hypothetical protein
MARTAWRCSQCGTVNEPDARACRSCGKWQSLFDLQDNALLDEEPDLEDFELDDARPEVFETEPFEPEVFGEEPEVPGLEEPELEEPEQEKRRVPRWLITAIWVTAALIWLVVSALVDR